MAKLNQTLLIVDDEPSVAMTLKMIFEREGYAVATAASCAEALNALSAGRKFDAVITDLNMEREDIGLEVVRAAQQLSARPVVVVCTGYANLENSSKALQMKIDYLATKPVDLEELIGAMQVMLRRRADGASKAHAS
jgi:two-component system OmpR family response regulator